MKKLSLLVSMITILLGTHVVRADDDDGGEDSASSYSADSSESSDSDNSDDSSEQPSIYDQAGEDTAKKAVEMVTVTALDSDAAGGAAKAAMSTLAAWNSDDPNKTVDVVRDYAIDRGVEYGVEKVAEVAGKTMIGDVVGAGLPMLFETTNTASTADGDDDSNHPQYQGTAFGDTGMIVEPVDGPTDELQIEPVSDDEMLSISVGSSAVTSTPAPEPTYTPPPAYTPAPAPTPSYSSSYSGHGGGVVPAM